jgi:hypothetical protein
LVGALCILKRAALCCCCSHRNGQSRWLHLVVTAGSVQWAVAVPIYPHANIASILKGFVERNTIPN